LILVFSVIGALVFCQTGSDYLNPEKVAERKEKARLHRMKQRLMKEERERQLLIFYTNAPYGGGRYGSREKRLFEMQRANFFARR